MTSDTGDEGGEAGARAGVGGHAAHQPLAGMLVVDLSRYLPGPFCTLQLSWLGAEVVAVERAPAGDPMRSMPPLGPDGVSLASASLSRGKRRLVVDLADEAGASEVWALCERADVVVEGFRPWVAERLGLGAAQLRKRNPRLVYCSLTGYGQTGPWAQVAGHDANYEAVAGLLARSGDPGRVLLPALPLADLAGGQLAATAVCAALVGRERTGEGCVIDVSLTEAALALQAHALPAASTPDARRGGGLLTGALASYGAYRCSDGEWLAVAPIEPKFFARLLELLELPAELADAQYEPARQGELRELLAQRLEQRPARDWHELLAGEETCVTRVLAPDEPAGHPQVAARGALERLNPGHEPATWAPAAPWVIDGVRPGGGSDASGGR